MTGPAGNWHRAWRRHLRVCREEVWGECPGSPAWQAVPLFAEGFTLKASNPHFSPDSMFGGLRRSLHLSYLQRVEGGLVALPWPQVAAPLLAMALGDEAGALPSYSMDFYTPADPRRCTGAIVDRLELSAAPPERDAVLRLSLKARAEEPNPALGEDDFDYSTLSPVPFTFDRAAVSLNGTALTDAEGFTLRVQNRLAEGPNRLGRVGFLLPGKRAVSLELQGLDDSDALNEAIREDAPFSFEAAFAHPDGHALALSVPVLHPQANAEEARPGELARSVVRMEAGTDEQGNDITWSLQLST